MAVGELPIHIKSKFRQDIYSFENTNIYIYAMMYNFLSGNHYYYEN